MAFLDGFSFGQLNTRLLDDSLDASLEIPSNESFTNDTERRFLDAVRELFDAWKEEEHPREKSGEGAGQFTSAGSGTASGEPEAPEETTKAAPETGKQPTPAPAGKASKDDMKKVDTVVSRGKQIVRSAINSNPILKDRIARTHNITSGLKTREKAIEKQLDEINNKRAPFWEMPHEEFQKHATELGAYEKQIEDLMKKSGELFNRRMEVNRETRKAIMDAILNPRGEGAIKIGNLVPDPEGGFVGTNKNRNIPRYIKAFAEATGVKGDVWAHTTDRPRAYYSKDLNAIVLREDDPEWVTWHEMGHWVETNTPGGVEASKAFLRSRIGDEQPKSLKEMTKNPGYTDDEFAVKDKFESAYSGKIYNYDATEITSMGI